MNNSSPVHVRPLGEEVVELLEPGGGLEVSEVGHGGGDEEVEEEAVSGSGCGERREAKEAERGKSEAGERRELAPRRLSAEVEQSWIAAKLGLKAQKG